MQSKILLYHPVISIVDAECERGNTSKGAIESYRKFLRDSFKQHCGILKRCLAKYKLYLLSTNYEPKRYGIVSHDHMHLFIATYKTSKNDFIRVHKLLIKALDQYQTIIKKKLGLDLNVKLIEDFTGKKIEVEKDDKGECKCKELSFPKACPVRKYCRYANNCLGTHGFCPNYISCVKLDKRSIENLLFYILRDKVGEVKCKGLRNYTPQYKRYYYIDEEAIKKYISIPITIPTLRSYYSAPLIVNKAQLDSNTDTESERYVAETLLFDPTEYVLEFICT